MLPEEGSLHPHSTENDQQKQVQLQEKLIQIQQNYINSLEKQEQLQAQVGLQIQLLDQKQERITLLEKQIELQEKYKQHYQEAIEKQNRLQAQVDSQKQLLAKRQEHIRLLEEQNHSQALQIAAFSVGSQNAQGKETQADFSTHSSPVTIRTWWHLIRQQRSQKRGIQSEKQPGRSFWPGGPSPRLSVVVILLLLVLVLLGGGSIGMYRAFSGRQPGLASAPTLTTVSSGKQFAHSSTSLSIQSSAGLDCTGSSTSIAFSTNRITYDNDGLQKMEDYYNADFAAIGHNKSAKPPLPLPSTLSSVVGDRSSHGVCNLDMQITNTSNTQVQIIQAGIQVSQVTPYANSRSYHLIDPCTIVAKCPSGGSGGGECGLYFLVIQLTHLPQAGQSFTQDYQAYDNCGLPVISPHQAIDFELQIFFNFPSSPGNVFFAMTPAVTEQTVAGTDHVTLSQMVGTQKFIDPKAFDCYGWNGSTFVLENPDASNVTVINRGSVKAGCTNNYPNV